jgi:hypothetical protein
LRIDLAHSSSAGRKVPSPSRRRVRDASECVRVSEDIGDGLSVCIDAGTASENPLVSE